MSLSIIDVCPSRHWFATCCLYARDLALPKASLRILLAFAGEDAVLQQEWLQGVLPSSERAGDFDALETSVLASLSQLLDVMEEALCKEVDGPQAAMFRRRLTSVLALFDGAEPRLRPLFRLWRVGLLCRVDEIVSTSRWKALRIRAITDFYYSQIAVQTHRGDAVALPSLSEAVDSVDWLPCLVGRRALLAEMTAIGPIHINLLHITRPVMSAIDTRTSLGPRSFQEIVAEVGGAAGISGGFFLYTETDIQPPSQRTDPVGLLVHRGAVLNPPIFHRAALCQQESGGLLLQPIGMAGVRLSWSAHAAGIVIDSCGEVGGLGKRVVFWNRAHAALPTHGLRSFAFVKREVVAAGVGLQEIPLAGGVILLPDVLDVPLPSVGESLEVALPSLGDGTKVMEAMAGGPMLLSANVPTLALAAEDFGGDAPPVTFSQDETFDQNLLPRMVAGLLADGSLMLAAIDGRHFHVAPGLTLALSAELMACLGCIEVMNLDGGSSKRMVVDGALLDLPSTEVSADAVAKASQKIRPVHSAIVFHAYERSSSDT